MRLSGYLELRAAPQSQHCDRVLLEIECGVDDELDATRPGVTNGVAAHMVERSVAQAILAMSNACGAAGVIPREYIQT